MINIENIISKIEGNDDIYKLIRKKLYKMMYKKIIFNKYILFYGLSDNNIIIDYSYTFVNKNKLCLITSLIQKKFKPNTIFYNDNIKCKIINIYDIYLTYNEINNDDIKYMYINDFMKKYYNFIIKNKPLST